MPNKSIHGTLEPEPPQLSRNFLRVDLLGSTFEVYRSTCNYLCFGLRTWSNKWYCVSFPLGRCVDPDCEDHNG